MRKFVFRCTACGLYVDVDEETKDSGVVHAPHMFGVEPDNTVGGGALCDGEFKRVWSLSGVVFSGSGFYSTDNRS